MGKLLRCVAVDATRVDIKGAVLFAEVAERLSVGIPYRCAVFTIEGSQFLECISTF